VAPCKRIICLPSCTGAELRRLNHAGRKADANGRAQGASRAHHGTIVQSRQTHRSTDADQVQSGSCESEAGHVFDTPAVSGTSVP
jgi:hypothetical protein